MYNTFMHLEDTEIYKHLKAKDIEDIVTSILKNNIEQKFVPLLNSIKIRMPEYTSHDEVHSINVLKNMWHIIPQKTKDNLSLVELVLLIYSAYLHDIGMLIDDQDIKNIINSTEYQDFKYVHIHDYEGNNDDIDIIKDYVRINHGHRSELYIESNKDIFTICGINYTSILKRICGGHTLNIDKINDYNENSRIADNCINEKYLTIILRIADLIDIYPNRTPSVLYEKIKPQNNFSIQEWQKHLSIKGWNINDTTIEIHAECSEYNIERLLRNFIQYINTEIKNCIACLGCKNDKYFFNLKGDISTDNIRSDGSYIYNDLKFELNTKNIISLLMGNRLYSRPEYALRELLQNSIDAVLFRQKLEQIHSSYKNFSPTISIYLDHNTLTIEDNGIGMDISIFRKYFMNVGKSYYKSTESIEKVRDFISVSEFGIGILSTFMIANNILIESKLRPSNLNDKTEPILIDIPTINDYFIQRKSSKQEFGTKIILNLKDNHPFKNIDIIEFIKDCAPLINSNIKLLVNGNIINSSIESQDYSSILNLRKCKIYNSFMVSSEELGVNGQIFLIKEQEKYVKCENIIAKNGFKISCHNLIPTWANIRAVLNITNPDIKLSANREALICNEEFNKLSIFIEREIENRIYEYLLNLKNTLMEDDYIKHLYKLISDEVLFTDNYSNKNTRIIPKNLEELVYLPIIDKNNNEYYKNVKELLLSEQIATFTRIPLKYKEKFIIPYNEIFELLQNFSMQNIPIVNNHKINSLAVHRILSALNLYVNKFITTSINGLNIYVLSKNCSDMYYPRYWLICNFSENIITNNKNEILFIQLQPDGFKLGYPDKLFNAKHPLIAPYLNIEKIKNSYEKGELEKSFDELKDQINESFGLYSFKFKGKKKTADIKKTYLANLNIYAKSLWQNYKKYKLVSAKEKFKKLTENDFPFGLSIIF